MLDAVYGVSVWLHVLAAIFWLGGSLFLALVVLPVFRAEGRSSEALELVHRVGPRFSRLGWAALAALAATGLVNLWFRGGSLAALATAAFWLRPAGAVLAAKLALVAAIVVLSLLHDRRDGPRSRIAPGASARVGEQAPEAGEPARRRARILARINLILGLAVVALAVVLVRFAAW